MPQDDLTSMKASSSTASKEESMSTTGKSKRRRLSGGLIETDHALLSESYLWRAVISQAIRDIYKQEIEGGERVMPYRSDVAAWVVTKDYEAVCHMAYVDPDIMREQIVNLLAMPRRLAMKYAIPLCQRLNGEESWAAKVASQPPLQDSGP